MKMIRIVVAPREPGFIGQKAKRVEIVDWNTGQVEYDLSEAVRVAEMRWEAHGTQAASALDLGRDEPDARGGSKRVEGGSVSADNYLLVRPRGATMDGLWTVTMEFASEDEPRPVRATDPSYRNKAEALEAAAERLQREAIVEYGIQVWVAPAVVDWEAAYHELLAAAGLEGESHFNAVAMLQAALKQDSTPKGNE